jgi:hypothetical protein
MKAIIVTPKNKKAILKLSIPLLIILIVFSCEKVKEVKEVEKESTTLTVCYDETKGADPWFSPLNPNWLKLNDSTLISCVKTYLLTDTIRIHEITVNHDGQFDPCLASICTTGRKIKVLIDRTDIIKLQKVRFYECN